MPGTPRGELHPAILQGGQDPPLADLLQDAEPLPASISKPSERQQVEALAPPAEVGRLIRLAGPDQSLHLVERQIPADRGRTNRWLVATRTDGRRHGRWVSRSQPIEGFIEGIDAKDYQAFAATSTGLPRCPAMRASKSALG